MSAALERLLAVGNRLGMPAYRTWLIEALLSGRQVEEGLAQVQTCLAQIEAQREYLVQSIVLSLRAGLNELRQRDDLARTDWQQALAVAQRQGAGLFALRASAGLAALEAREGQAHLAIGRLQSALAPFAADWHCRDLDRARAVLERLCRDGPY